MIHFKVGFLFSCFLSCRRIKNAIIGNQTKKSSFMLLGVIPRLVGHAVQEGKEWCYVLGMDSRVT